jgi:hypothetical protein
MAFATAAGESEPLLRGVSSERVVTPSERRSKMFRYAAPLFAGAVALGVLARADPLNVLATSREGGAWVYDNPATWLPDWGASIAPTPGIEDTRASFVVRTFCKPDAMKKNYADFWLDGEKEAYVVHHDYGSNSFFDSSNGIKMERFIVNETSGERGYRVTTDAVDFEYGFALKNLETGAWLYEIGKGSEALVYNEPCVQQYGAYFNRVRTAEPDPNDINYVFGSCDQVCADDYLDTANQVRTAFGSVPPYPDEMVVGQSDDARLFTLHSARLGNWIRSAAQRDKGFAESEDESRVIVAHVDAYGPNLRWPAGSAYLLMAQLSVRQEGERRHHALAHGLEVLRLRQTVHHHGVLRGRVRPVREVERPGLGGLDGQLQAGEHASRDLRPLVHARRQGRHPRQRARSAVRGLRVPAGRHPG